MSTVRKTGDAMPAIGPGGRRGPGGPPMGARLKAEKPKNAYTTLKRLLKYMSANIGIFILLLAVMLVVSALNLAGPALQGKAIDAMTLTDKIKEVNFAELQRMLILLAVTYGAASLLTYIQGIAAAKLSQRTVFGMRNALFKKIEKLPVRYTDTHTHGDIMSRMTNDVENVSNTISQSIGSLISAIFTVVGTIIIMLNYNVLLTGVCFIMIPATIAVSSFLARWMRKYFTKQQKLLGALNGHIEEMISGYKTVVAFGREEKATEKFNNISKKLKGVAIRADIFGGVMGPIMHLIANGGFIAVAVVGGWLAFKGDISIGVIQAFLLYSKQFGRPINELAEQYAQIMTAIAGAERFFEILDEKPETDEGAKAVSVEDIKGNLDFEDVIFSYIQGEPVLKGFNLKVRQGEKIAIVGATGSGKTTVVNLLTRFYDIDGGSIKLDGNDIREIPLNVLRQAVAIVLQDTVLFSDTIGKNICYGRLDASDNEVRSAAETANINRFIERLPQKYDTMLTESGNNLSQGQRQLISIARAVLADPKILILDEATSSVDTRTEVKIQKAMNALMKGRNSLIIAHRLSTIRDADLIVVIENGVAAEAGSHDELMAKQGCYYNLYQRQFTGFRI